MQKCFNGFPLINGRARSASTVGTSSNNLQSGFEFSDAGVLGSPCLRIDISEGNKPGVRLACTQVITNGTLPGPRKNLENLRTFLAHDAILSTSLARKLWTLLQYTALRILIQTN